jgi:hypothetical protein
VRSSARLRLGLLAATALAALVSACGPSPADGAMNPEWPAEIRQAPVVVREAYAFADEHPEVLSAVPCYCGCGAIGHTSNLACYVAEAGGYDLHALGCSICVDITLDARRMLEEGRPIDQVRAAIDATYARYGTSNMP